MALYAVRMRYLVVRALTTREGYLAEFPKQLPEILLRRWAPWLAFAGPALLVLGVVAGVVNAIQGNDLYGDGAPVNVPPGPELWFRVTLALTLGCLGSAVLCGAAVGARIAQSDFQGAWKLRVIGAAAGIAVVVGLLLGIWLTIVGTVIYVVWSIWLGVRLRHGLTRAAENS